MLTQKRLRECLKYNPDTGEFFWNISKKGTSAGDRAGATDAHGYRIIGVDKTRYKAHRLAWLYVYGEWPKHQSMHVTFKREMLDDYGNVTRKDRDFIILGGYSGWEQKAPDEDGYVLDWAAERFYGLESTGYKRIVLTPSRTRVEGSPRNLIKRRIEGESN